MQDNYINGRLGMVIDGTGKDFNKIQKQRAELLALGYDTYMIFVNTSLEVAQERNQMRARKLPEAMVEEMWKQVQFNLGKFQKLFGGDNLIIVDNSSYDNQELLDEAEKQIRKHVTKSVKNPIGKRWIKDNS